MAKKKTTHRHKGEKKQSSRKGELVFNQETRDRYAELLVKVSKRTQPIEDAVRKSQRLSKDDFAIRINARG